MNSGQPEPAANEGEFSTLQALTLIGRQMGLDLVPDTLLRQQPFQGIEPTNEWVVAAGASVGIKVRAVKLKNGDLLKIRGSLPAIIRFPDGRSLVLVSITDKAGTVSAIIREPFAPESAVAAIEEQQFFQSWDGDILLLKRRMSLGAPNQPFGLGWLVGQMIRQKSIFRDIGIAAVFHSIFAIAPPLIIMAMLDRVLTHHSSSTLIVIALGMTFIVISDTMLSYLRRYFTEVATSRIDGKLNLFYYDRVLNLPISFFERMPVGEIGSKLHQVWKIRTFLTGQLFTTLLDLVSLFVLLPVMFYLNTMLTLMVLAISGTIALIFYLFLPTLRRLHQKVVDAQSALGTQEVETLHGMRAIKSLALDGLKRKERDVLVARLVEAQTAFQRMSNWPQTIVQPLQQSIYMGSMMIGCAMVLSGNSTMTAGAIMAFGMLCGRATQPLVAFAGLINSFEEARAAVGIVGSIINTEPEGGRTGDGLKLPIKGHIIFDKIRFRYSPETPYVLNDVGFEIPQGTILGVMGRSGSGKSTLTRLLQGLHRDYDGMIKIDGMDLKEMDLDHLRTHIGMVMQENFLFSGTVRDNISAGRRNAPFEDIVRAAQLSGAEEFIERLPRGYNTWISEGAVNFSGGQRQRLAIARTLLTDPPVLVLDEATSALDAESEAIVNANMLRIAKGRTVIIISHRLSVLVDAHSILVMERGQVYDHGPHAALLGRCDIYKTLWYQQNRHLDPSASNVRLAAQ